MGGQQRASWSGSCHILRLEQYVMRTIRNRAGFSLIELVVVMAMMAILTSFAFWRMGPSIERGKVRRGASMLAADLQYAQMIAARQRKPVVLITVPATKSYIVRDAGSTTIFRERYLGPNTEFGLDLLSATPSTVKIFPNGVTQITANFQVGLNSNTRNVRFTRAGQIRITP